jgi:hypothetical protein
MSRITVLFALSVHLAWAQSAEDSVVLAAFKIKATPVDRPSILYRRVLNKGLDLVIAVGDPSGPPDPTRFRFEIPRKIGLFLQEHGRPDRVSTLSIDDGGCLDCTPRVERATATDTVIFWEGEKGSPYPNQKFTYDIARKSMLARSSYETASMHAVVSIDGGAVFVGRNPKGPIAVEYRPDSNSPFRVLTPSLAGQWAKRVPLEAAAIPTFGPSGSFSLRREPVPGGEQFVIVERRDRQIIRHPLPRSTYAAFSKARPARVKDGYTAGVSTMNESVGPWKPEGNRLWFGKTFYDGEGSTGIGGFGYFDATDGKYHLFSPPEIVDWSVSAIDLSSESIWMSLVHRGEWGVSSGGILRFDRGSQTVERFAIPDMVREFIRIGDRVAMATDLGIVVAEHGQVRRYFVDVAGDGRLQIAEAVR